MRGCIAVPFSSLFASTVEAHGVAWAFKHYKSRGMSEFEFGCWLNGWLGR